ncbi:MAG: Ig-like domain-containing protein [Halobacteriota archaeon]|jgi:hypothetical protein
MALNGTSTEICNNGFSVSGYVDGKYAGQATTYPAPSGCDISMIFRFSTNDLTLGEHAVTIVFAGNAQYAPSTATAYVRVVAT